MDSLEIFSKECPESKSSNQFVKEKVDVPVFMIDDIEDVVDLPKYDEYDDDYIVDFELTYLEQENAFHPSKNDFFSAIQGKKSSCRL
jgi:hypothetical protein